MILQALNAYYERLAADPESDVATYGYSRQQVSFIVMLERDGTLHEIVDARRQDDKGKLKNRFVIVPGNAKPSGSGINPCFLWDNAAYMLGHKLDDPKPERTREAFEAFRQRHLDAKPSLADEGFLAVCRFLENWSPYAADEHAALKDLTTGFGVFQLRNTTEYIHNRPTIREWWEEQLAADEEADEDTIGQCLVTGQVGPIARLHEPKIKGVYGAQSSGATLVSFNCDAFESYGKRQSVGSPVAERVAFQYATALNRLLDPASGRRMSVGDTSMVFWAEKPSTAEDFFADLFNPSVSAEDQEQVNKVRPVLEAISRGGFPQELGDPKTPFYVLGLSPNAARVSVRFWLESTLGKFLGNLGRHYAHLDIARGAKDLPQPPLWRLLRETVRDSKDIPDLLEGALMRAILSGGQYPQMFYSALLRRIRADREVRHVRAAAIKACLIRNYQKEVPVALDPDRPDEAYQLGRLFAELEKAQEDALPGVNDTIKDRYFSAASATPASVFPRLIRMNQHHLGKLERPARAYREKRIQGIAGRIKGFQSHLNLEDQGLFAIGYYHQRQSIFTKRADKDDESTSEE